MKNQPEPLTWFLLLFIITLKLVFLSILLPPGSSPNEVAHYRVAEAINISEDWNGSKTRITHRELSTLTWYGQTVQGRLPLKSMTDRARLDRELRQPDARHRVSTGIAAHTAKGSIGYYNALAYLQRRLDPLPINDRWFMLRLVHVMLMLLSTVFLVCAVRNIMQERAVFYSIVAALLYAFGPWSGIDGILIGPRALLCALWAAWIWRCSILYRRRKSTEGILLALISLAMSAAGPDGLIAGILTGAVLAVLLVGMRRVAQRLVLMAGIILALAGVALWVLDFVNRSFPAGVSYDHSSSFLAALHSVSQLPSADPQWITGIPWILLVVLGCYGLFGSTRGWTSVASLSITALAGLMLSIALYLIRPGWYPPAPIIAPLAAVFIATGMSAVFSRHVRVIQIIAMTCVGLDLLFLVLWIIPGIYT